eukprot:TRINITY_DN5451_c0_g1_i1.p1 TRINITY_DN5451_c0_g1~~TRINITY_DN5451_c0_g1_i1.p1  ORF type:complete len:1261 (+),score=390.46 TRINITY_DN5451_c0_g1_i1:131-3913(+)
MFSQPVHEEQRDVFNNRKKNHHFCNNFITTSKYTWWNFLPKNLFFQFGRVSNCYFAFNMAISLVPGVSPISPITAILPLVFVLTVAAVKDGYEDYQRHKDDNKWNSLPGKKDDAGHTLSGVLHHGKVDPDVPSKDIAVGDIIKIARGETVRADTLLLSSSDSKEHTCAIETMQLDGETNAKMRQAAQTTVGARTYNLTEDLVTAEAFAKAELHLQCVGPGPDLHDWTGKLTYGDRSEGVSIGQFLYRGCVVVNTAWVFGMVVYTGVDTKMQRNNKPKPAKKSKLDDKLNWMIIGVLILQHIIIFLMCGLSVGFQNENQDEKWYIDYYLGKFPGAGLFFWRYMTYFILMSFMIPISLFVTIEICKAGQALFMLWDLRMRCWMRDANNAVVGDEPFGCNPRTSNLNEQLAIVKYIFSDKTGTLTENRMEFHTGEIGNPEQEELKKAGQSFSNITDQKSEGDIAQYLRKHALAGPIGPPQPVPGGGRSPTHTDNVLWYMLTLALCHELSILADDEGESEESAAAASADGAGDQRNYQGASPDEVALAKCAQYNGIEFRARSSGSISVAILGTVFEYRILDLLPFTSKRKMMSIVLLGPCDRSPAGELVESASAQRFCLVKGADTVMIENCAGGMKLEKVSGEENWRPVDRRKPDHWYSDCYHPRLWNELSKLAGIGLRTLVLAYKPLPDTDSFNRWHDRYGAARKIVQPDQRTKEMEDCWEQMEQDFFICGATAIEDKLQDRVPQTVDFLLRAGIVVWMLTGDKQETAETIAGTARLVDKQTWDILNLVASVPGNYSDDLSLHAEERERRSRLRSAWVQGLAKDNGTPEQEDAARAYRDGEQIADSRDFLKSALQRSAACRQEGKKCAVVTDGGTLGVICPPGPLGKLTAPARQAVEHMWADFAVLSQQVNSGILCRLTPEQKGKIVRVFQQTTGQTALAIGDGANDVPMINESFVGVGIMGLEGSQAVLASDYAIPRFKHLKRLMFVHGRYSLYRNAMTVLFSFYKNFVLAVIQVYYSFFCGFSGQTLFDSWLLAMQNFAFTSIPPLFVGLFEKDIDEDSLECFPSLYMPLRDGLYFDRKALVMWLGESFVHSALVFWLTYTTMRNDDVGGDSGRSGDILMVGALTLFCQISTVLTKLALHLRYWVPIQVFGLVISWVFFVSFLLVYSGGFPVGFLVWLGDASFYMSGLYILADVKLWLWAVFFVVGVILAVDLPLLYLQRQYFPSLRDIAQRKAQERRKEAAMQSSAGPQTIGPSAASHQP